MQDRRPSSGRRKSSSGSRTATIVACIACAVLAVAAVVLLILIVKESKESEQSTTEAATQVTTQAATKEATTEKKTETEKATEAPTTEEATTEEVLPDGTIYEVPEPKGNAYMYDGQVFSVCCAGESTQEYYANMVNTLGSRLPAKVQLYDILAPTAYGACLSKEVQNEMGGNNQPEAIDHINSLIDETKAIGVPACANIIKHNAEYIYYNSDHHWTVMGAYYAYEAWCKAKGIKAHTPNNFLNKYSFEGFLGSFYSLAGSPSILEKNRDTVLAFVPNGTNDEIFIDKEGNEIAWNVIYDVTEWARTSKYNCFIGGDNPYTEIVNPEINDGSAVMLVKESYGNAFAPFLVDHYQYTYIIDYRYYVGNLTSFVSNHNVKDVILLNNMEAIGTGRADTILGLFP